MHAILRFILIKFLTLAYGFRQLWWRIRQPDTFGVKALVISSQKRVLLVEHTYQSGYHLPGGGLKSGEQALEAAKRELLEETGLDVQGTEARLLGRYTNFSEFKHDHVTVFVFEDVPELTLKLQMLEIKEGGFFSLDSLPRGVTSATVRRIKEALGKAPVAFEW